MLIEFAEFGIGCGASEFEKADSFDEFIRHGAAGYGEVFDGTLSRSSVESIEGDVHFAHGVFFKSHCHNK